MPAPCLPEPKTPEAQDALETQLAAAVYLAGEALASEENLVPAAFAIPEGDAHTPSVSDFDWLRGLVCHIRQALAADPRRAELLRLLPQGLGNGEALPLLFGNLFPQQRHQRKVARHGMGKLAQTQVEVLRDYAQGNSLEQIAGQRQCKAANVYKILKRIQGRLHTQTHQESVAVAIARSYLPLDVMDFVRETAHCQPRDYQALGCQISAHGLKNLPDAASWQELGAFGLLLMLATNTVSYPLMTAVRAPTGVVYHLTPERNGTYRVQQFVGPGRLRQPRSLAIVPPEGWGQGFASGDICVVHYLPGMYGMNDQEIVVYAPDGTERRVFRGGLSCVSRLNGANDIRFDESGALLATGAGALLRFMDGGARVQPLITRCCSSVCPAPKGDLYLAHSSTRGGSIGLYGGSGKLRRQFGQQPMETHLFSLQRLSDGRIAVLRYTEGSPESRRMLIFDETNEKGEFPKIWRVPGAGNGAFAFHAGENCFYIPCPEAGNIAIFDPDGQLQGRITLGKSITPYAVAFDHDGALWCVGSLVSG